MMMTPDATYDTADWRGICPICGDEIAADAEVEEVGIGDEPMERAHSECVEGNEDDGNN